jgi:hypothetical protein
MKIALITGGQPRFTPDFIDLMDQLTGFDSADIYMCLWSSEWATDNTEARIKIEKVLPPKYSLAKVSIVDEPQYVLPPHTLNLPVETLGNIRWFYKRRFAQAMALSLTYDLVDQDYDLMVRFRLDGKLSGQLDLDQQDLTQGIIIPNDFPSTEGIVMINDQFAIGTQEDMKFYCGIGRTFPDIVPESEPSWETLPHGKWALEHLLGKYYQKHQKIYRLGKFSHYINTYGRSRFTDKHYHHSIAQDPT